MVSAPMFQALDILRVLLVTAMLFSPLGRGACAHAADIGTFDDCALVDLVADTEPETDTDTACTSTSDAPVDADEALLSDARVTTAHTVACLALEQHALSPQCSVMAALPPPQLG